MVGFSGLPSRTRTAVAGSSTRASNRTSGSSSTGTPGRLPLSGGGTPLSLEGGTSVFLGGGISVTQTSVARSPGAESRVVVHSDRAASTGPEMAVLLQVHRRCDDRKRQRRVGLQGRVQHQLCRTGGHGVEDEPSGLVALGGQRGIAHSQFRVQTTTGRGPAVQ